MTLGEKRVRVEFNPSNSDYVSQLKTKAAELINLINDCPSKEDDQFIRLKMLAMTSIEEGAMWAVKMATV